MGNIKHNPVPYMFVASIILGLNSVFGAMALESMPVFFYIGVRYMLAGTALLCVGSFQRNKFSTKPKPLGRLLVRALTMLIVVFAWMFALTLTEPINASIAFLLTPVLVYVGSVVVLKEPRSNRALSGSLVAMMGGMLLFGAPSLTAGDSDAVLGNGLLMIAAFMMAVLIIQTKTLYKYYSSNYILGSCYVLVGGVSSLVSLATENHGVLADTTMFSWAGLFLGTTVGALGVYMFYKALNYMRAEDSASISYVDPLAGSIGAAIVFGNTLEPASLVATLVIVAGVIVAHPMHIHRTLFYHKENTGRLEEFLQWLRGKYESLEHAITKLF